MTDDIYPECEHNPPCLATETDNPCTERDVPTMDDFRLIVFLNWTQRDADAGFSAAVDAYVADVAGDDLALASECRKHAAELFSEVQS